MAQHRVCPWWLGPLLASRLRRLLQDPDKLLAPFVSPGMTVLEPGPGMGFFTIPMARMVGEQGCVYAIDVQRKMLEGLERRARKSGVSTRIRARLATAGGLNIADLAGRIDLVWAFAVVHEMPSAERFFADIAPTLKADGVVLLAEPAGHVKPADFEAQLQAASRSGLHVVRRPELSRSLAAVLKRSS
jgi:2-polyprenyl-3-methyl-5-hydroxy-6-metoxy-1,4-benzoquinol methylase